MPRKQGTLASMDDEFGRFRTWFRAVAGDLADNNSAIGRRIGTDNHTVRRHLAEPEKPNPATIVMFARGFGVSPLDGLVACGLLTEDEASRGTVEQALRKATMQQLAAELHDRVKSESAGEGEDPLADDPNNSSTMRVGGHQTQVGRDKATEQNAKAQTRRNRLTKGLEE